MTKALSWSVLAAAVALGLALRLVALGPGPVAAHPWSGSGGSDARTSGASASATDARARAGDGKRIVRPMHHDEANQAVRFGRLLETGEYRYDRRDHHGPTLYYLTLPVAWLRGPHPDADRQGQRDECPQAPTRHVAGVPKTSTST